MNELRALSSLTKTYWVVVVLTGLLSLTGGVAATTGMERLWMPLLAYTVVATLASGLKIRLPGILGTMSMNYVVTMAALLTLNAGSALVVAVVSTVGQCLISAASRPKWFQVAFSGASVPLPVLAAAFCLHSSFFARFELGYFISLLSAVMAYFLINTGMIAGIIALTTKASVFSVWHNSYLWTAPHYLVGGCIAAAIGYLERFLGWPALAFAIPPLYLIYYSYSLYLRRIEEQQRHTEEMAGLHLRTVETLAVAIDAKDGTTAAHLRRVRIYATEVGREMNLSLSEMQALEAAALLHDVGKLAVPEYIISKPGKLTVEEFEKMKVHPVVGAEILEKVGFPYPVVPMVRSHHEKYDGTGYPDGLLGGQIPVGARILSAIDCLDALASDRQYRKAMPLEEAMKYIERESGKSFDPQVVSILLRRFPELERKARQSTDEAPKLSSNIRISRGAAPAAGLAEERQQIPARRHTDFSMTIASARREFQLLLEATNDLGSSLSLDDTFAILGARLSRLVEHDALVIYLIDRDKLIPAFAKGESSRLFLSLQIPMGQGLSGWVAENGTTILNGNPMVEPGYLNDPAKITVLRSAVSVPIQVADETIGVMTLYQLRSDAFTTDDLRLLLAVAPKAGLAIQNASRFESISAVAETDELTGLPNARFLFNYLEKSVATVRATGEPLGIAVMDLDGFKAANDTYGHLAGNQILRSVANGLRSSCRAEDVVARLGGDEFVLIARRSKPDLEDTVRRAQEFVRGMTVGAERQFVISMSAGTAHFMEDGCDSETLLQKADERMYTAKRLKKRVEGSVETKTLHVPEDLRGHSNCLYPLQCS